MFLLIICIYLSLAVNSSVLTYLILLVYISGILVILLYLTNLVSNFWLSVSWKSLFLIMGLMLFSELNTPNFYVLNWSGEGASYLWALFFVLIILLMVLVILTKILKIGLTLRNF